MAESSEGKFRGDVHTISAERLLGKGDRQDESMLDGSIQFNRSFFRRFWQLCKVMFPRFKSIAVLLFVFLLCVAILQQFAVYNVGLIASRYYKVLGDRDLSGFKSHTIYAMVLVIGVAFVKSTANYVCSVLYVIWRENITKFLHKNYFRDVLYYSLNVKDTSIDNLDQRITQDVDRFCKSLSTIIADLLISPFTIAYYLYETWRNTGYIGPVCVFSFFVISTIINKFLMSPVVAMVFKQERLEGNFRFKHMQIRSNAEAAAFYRCGRVEREKADIKLTQLLKTQQKLVVREYALNFAISTADYVGSILSYIILAIPIFAGWYDDLDPTDLGALISKNSFVTMYLINCFTKLIDMAATVTDLAGYTHRIGQLQEKIVYFENKNNSAMPSCNGGSDGYTNIYNDVSEYAERNRVAYKVSNVTYGPPDSQQILVKNLSLEIVSGVNILISGESGCGKSSLLRVMDGLWDAVEGHIDRFLPHGHRGVLFLPQKPFLSDGTLREQILYPAQEFSSTDSKWSLNRGYQSADNIEDHQMIDLLQICELTSLYDRIGGLDVPVDWNWYDILSPGEMQRLSFVRLFYHHPPFAILDESTSQIGIQAEKTLYQKCCDLNITLLSVGHRHSLREFHQKELKIDGTGGWTIETIENATL